MVVGLAAICVLLYYPGKLDPDSATQLGDALSGHFTDANPPAMSALWRLLLPITPAPLPMLLYEVALYWLGVWAFWTSVPPGRTWRSLLPLGAALHPLALVLLGAILKDVLFASSLSAGFGLLYRQRALGRRVGPVLSVVIALLFAFAALVRWNGAFALAPLLIFWMVPAAVRPIPVLAGTFLVAAVSVPVSDFVDHSLLKASRSHFEVHLELFDIAGIEHFSGDRRLLKLPPGCYSPYSSDLLNLDRCGKRFDQVTGGTAVETGQREAAIRRIWLSDIVSRPVAYAWHRLLHFNSSINFLVSPDLTCRAEPDYDWCKQPVASRIRADFIRKNVLYWPCVWLAAGLALLFGTSATAASRALAWSGICYAGGFLIVGIANDWRFHLWTIFAIAMAIALHLSTAREWKADLRTICLAALPVALLGYAARILFLVMGW